MCKREPAASLRSRPPTSRCRPTRPAMSANRSLSSSPRASPRPRTPRNWSTSPMSRCRRWRAPPRRWRPQRRCLWDTAPGNLCIDIEVGDEAATAAAFAGAAHVVRLETWAQRVTGVPMEPRTNLADYDPATRPIHPLHRQRPRRRQGAARPGPSARRLAGAGAGRVPRHGRQFRHAQFLLPRICAARLGGAPARTAGQMDLRAPRIVSQRLSGPRPDRVRPNWRSTPRAISSQFAASI